MAELLVSVRSVAEAEAALAGGAAVLDVKEPAHGSLGRADDATIAAVLAFVAGRRPVSAALGELAGGAPPFPGPGLSFAKWGLSGCGRGDTWRQELGRAFDHLPDGCRPVGVAYADWRRAAAPPPAEVGAFVAGRRGVVLLLDTWGKDGSTLLDWLSVADLYRLRRRCRADGVQLALAGSLGAEQIAALLPVQPDWFAVRGAACRDGRRSAAVDAAAVRRLASLVGGPVTAATPGN
jgi:uncharacterized protein (UPF0264 family)